MPFPSARGKLAAEGGWETPARLTSSKHLHNCRRASNRLLDTARLCLHGLATYPENLEAISI